MLAVWLLQRMVTVPETVELARATYALFLLHGHSAGKNLHDCTCCRSGKASPASAAAEAGADALRLARHAMARGHLLQQLLQRLATVPETVELARATGLTLPQILYNAQMIRTWSLLLRNAQRQG